MSKHSLFVPSSYIKVDLQIHWIDGPIDVYRNKKAYCINQFNKNPKRAENAGYVKIILTI